MAKIAAMGDNVVDCYLSKGQMYPGGNCLNVSVFLRRFGAQTAYVGAIGRDAAGDVIHRALSDEKVDISHLRRLEQGPTAYCVIGHRDAERVFVTFDLGVSMFQPSGDDFDFLEGFDAVHVGQSSGLDDHIEAIAARAPLSYDFSTRRDLDHRRSIGPLCFLASVSGGDLLDEEVATVSNELLAAGAKWVLITRGRHGAALFDAQSHYEVEATPVEAIDTLGAGDTFIARTLYGLVRGEEPLILLEAAARAAAETCRYFGAVGHGAPIDIAADLEALASIAI